MPTTPTPQHQPQRQRGHDRVAAILQAAVTLFSEKGFEAATMTEIATRSGTATGSLYRFFPSKDLLADALLLQYTEHVTERMNALKQQAPGMPLEQLTVALIQFMQAPDRSFASSLVDARGVSAQRREQFRQDLRQQLAGLLQIAIPGLPATKAAPMAVLLLHTLKAVPQIVHEKPAVRAVLLAELRQFILLYLHAAAHEVAV